MVDRAEGYWEYGCPPYDTQIHSSMVGPSESWYRCTSLDLEKRIALLPTYLSPEGAQRDSSGCG